MKSFRDVVRLLIAVVYPASDVCNPDIEELRELNDVDLEGNGEGYSGTFRWKNSKILPSMPKTHPNDCLNVSNGWMEYFLSREPTQA